MPEQKLAFIETATCERVVLKKNQSSSDPLFESYVHCMHNKAFHLFPLAHFIISQDFDITISKYIKYIARACWVLFSTRGVYKLVYLRIVLQITY